MCEQNWSYNTQCCQDCSVKCTIAFEIGGVVTQHEILLINSGGAASPDELEEAKRHDINQARKGYK